MNTSKMNIVGAVVVAFGIVLGSAAAFAHGDVTPQAVKTDGLKALGKAWLDANPYRENPRAVEIGKSGFAQNCARCHGIDAISGGIAPDLRYLEQGDSGDEWFKYRVQNGSVRDGKVYMPAFDGVLSQEALWAIRSYLESRYEE